MSTVPAPSMDIRALIAEPEEHDPSDSVRMGLGLSGGGYRAMLFHLGGVWRLNELGLLKRLDRVSSVSGGSILAAQLGLRWNRLAFDSNGVAGNFVAEIVGPIRRVASTTIDWPAALLGWLGLSATSFYRWLLYRGATLQDLPDRPRFVINATNVQSGRLWRFSKPYAWDWRVGKIPHPNILLARAVAASTAWPPLLSPVIFRFKSDQYSPNTGADLQRPPFTTRVLLTDGGVYDNLGLESVWKQSQTVLISDGSGQFAAQRSPATNWLGQVLRVISMIQNQVASLRKRNLIASFRSVAPEFQRSGAYWGLGSHLADYPVTSKLACTVDGTRELGLIPTRLKHIDAGLQERLINWGYAICDAAVRSHLVTSAPMGKFPYPDRKV